VDRKWGKQCTCLAPDLICDRAGEIAATSRQMDMAHLPLQEPIQCRHWSYTWLQALITAGM
jgi:hypothetical protein